MRVPVINTPASPIPTADGRAIRHDVRLGAVKQEMAHGDELMGQAKSVSAVLGGLGAVAESGVTIARKMQEDKDRTDAMNAVKALQDKVADAMHGGGAAGASPEGGGQNPAPADPAAPGAGAASPDNPPSAASSPSEGTSGKSDPASDPFLGRRGKNAIGAVAQTREWFQETVDGIAKGLSPNAARMFSERATELRFSYMTSVARHEANERHNYEISTLNANIETDRQAAINGASDEKISGNALARQENLIRERSAKLGLAENTTEDIVGKEISKTMGDMFDRMVADKNYTAALAIYTNPRLSETDRRKAAAVYQRARLEDSYKGARRKGADSIARFRNELEVAMRRAAKKRGAEGAPSGRAPQAASLDAGGEKNAAAPVPTQKPAAKTGSRKGRNQPEPHDPPVADTMA